MASNNSTSKRAQMPRVIPAIPRALDKSKRDKQQQQQQQQQPSQPDAAAKLADKAVENPPDSPAAVDENQNVDVESAPVVAQAEPAAATNLASDTESASQATASKVDTPTEENTAPKIPTPVPPLETSLAQAPKTNGVPDTKATASQGAPLEPIHQSPTSSRQVRDLPPPFYPGNQQSGPPSASSTQPRPDQAATRQMMHQPKPSANSLTFGGYRDSANSSPAFVPTHSQGQPYNTNAVQGYPAYGAQSHGYHVSDPNAGPVYPPPPFSPGAQAYGYPRDYTSNVPPHQPRGYQHPPRHQQPSRRPYEPQMPQRYPAPPPVQAMYQPQHLPHRPVDAYNETPKTMNPDTGPARPNFSVNRFSEQQGGVASNNTGPRPGEPQMAARVESSPMIQYLRGQFGNAEFADYVIQLSHSGYSFPPTMLPAHGVILARSPKLRSLITMQRGNASSSQNEPKQLNVPISDRFLNLEIALMNALMRLYGEPLPDRELVARLAGPSAYLEAGNVYAIQMRFALAFAAAGHFLQLDEIISHGLHLAEGLLGWDTIGKPLAFGLEGGLSLHFSQPETANKDKESNSSIDGTPAKLDSPSSAPAYGYYSDRVLSSAVNFLVYNCPPDFALSPSAPQMNDPPRLPADAEPKHSRSTSRLSQIRFGDMTMDNSAPHDPVVEKMSSVLLSLPFPLLVHVLESNVLGERLGWVRVAEIMRDTVQERETRRQRAMKSIGASAPASAVEERLWRTARWIESVEPNEQRPTGLKLSRQLAGNETPPSAGSVAA